jgi:AraC-like DNA-binding protein
VIQNNERKLQYYRGQWLNLKPGELPTSKEDAFMTKIDGLIKENISSEKLTVDYIADKTALSRMQLFRKVKAITRCAPSEYIKQYRLQYAAQLIERHSMDIQEVAYAVGFSDPKYFSLCFSEKFKMAPSLYAKKHNNKE